MRNNNRIILIVILLILITVGRNFIITNDPENKNSTEEYLVCMPDKEDCLVTINNQEIKISIVGDIKPLQAFFINLNDSSDSLVSASVIFQMSSMDMGINQFLFKKIGKNTWQSKVVIPICTAGRNNWIAELLLDIGGIRKKYFFKVLI